jgi:hypothetical protein
MKSIFLIFLFLAGCATQPMPAPACDMTVAGKCREMTAGETVGAGVRGHGENTKDEK